MRPTLATLATLLAIPLLCAGLCTACGAEPAPADDGAPLEPPESVREQLAPDVLAALQDALDAVRERPNDPGTWLALGMTYEAHSLAAEAAGAYAEAERRGTGSPRAAYHLGRALSVAGAVDDALAAYQRSEQRAADYAALYWRRGQLLLEAERLEEAESAFAKAAALEPDGLAGPLGLARVALVRDDSARVAELLEPLAARFPEQGELQHLLGRAYRAMGRMDEAREALARWDGRLAPRPDPWTDEVAEHRAGYHAVMEQALDDGRAGRAEQAIAPLLALHQADPDDSAALEKLVAAYREAGRGDDARRVLQAALQRDADHYRAWFALAEIEEQRGDLRAALNATGRCLELQPSFARAHELAARLLWKAGDIEAAALALADALVHGGPDVTNLRKLARARKLLEQWDAAAAALRQAIELQPGDPGLHAELADTQLDAFDLAGAHVTLEAARAIDEQHPEVRRVWARYVDMQGLMGPGDIDVSGDGDGDG